MLLLRLAIFSGDIMSPVNCPVGTFYHVIKRRCEDCPHGTYQPSEGDNTCFKCPSNMSTEKKRSKNLTHCRGEPSLCINRLFQCLSTSKVNFA